jgi:hypothetical protein
MEDRDISASDAICDVSALHRRLVAGFVIGARLEPGWQVELLEPQIREIGVGGLIISSPFYATAPAASPPPATVTVGKANAMWLASNAFLINA